ncbi:MAG TPA: T9SS type A sorting domain-containing protein [Chitinophagales bacterium]|nr:T9SS type A sorting domain-containing protein [Chitinophagales bacterium]
MAQPILPDIQTISNDLNFDGNPGNVTLSLTLLNGGTDIYPGGPAGFYFSSDTLLDEENDSLVFKVDVPSIGYGDTVSVIDTIDFCDPAVYESFPAYVKNGAPFYVLYKLDYADNIQESDEGNNTGGFQLPLEMACITAIAEIVVQSFSVYPNPTDGSVVFAVPAALADDAIIKVHNMDAREVFSLALDHERSGVLDLSFLTPGIYLVTLSDKELFYQSRIVIE